MQKDLLREIGLSLLGPRALASSLSVQWGHGDCARPRVVLPGPGLLPRCLPAGAHSTLTPCGAPALPWGGEASLPPSARPSAVLGTSYKALTFRTPPPSPGITDERWDISTSSNSVRRSNPVFFCPQHLSEHLRGVLVSSADLEECTGVPWQYAVAKQGLNTGASL